jgi:hypothetical protein
LDYQIVIGYPTWFVLLCIFAGIIASMLLYFRNRHNEFPAWLRRLLGITRFLTVALAAFLLLSPLLRLISRQYENPIIVVAQDNSMSLVSGSDSAFYRDSYLPKINEVIDQLAGKYDLRLFTFGDAVKAVNGNNFDSLSFDEKTTNIGELFDMMEVRFANRHIGAMVLASDGIYNTGTNPLFKIPLSPYPVYTIALGDTSLGRDAYLKRVLYNKIAYQGNDFPVEAIINAVKMDGATLTLTLTEGDSILARQQIPVRGMNYSTTLRLIVPAGEAGARHYVLRITSGMEEQSLANNRYDLFVDVLQSRQKVLILAHSPHPDISALHQAIGGNLNYEVDDYLAEDFNGPLQAYDLVILHQIPSSSPASMRLASAVTRSKLPLLYVIGPQTDLGVFNTLVSGIQLNVYNQQMNDALPVVNDAFGLFEVNSEARELMGLMPPLQTPFARYNTSHAAHVLFFQKTGNVPGSNPLYVFFQEPEKKYAVITGSGLWKWRVKTWQERGHHEPFDELLNKSVQFLSLKEDKRRFRVHVPGNIPENMPVELDAEFYNESFEPVNEAEAGLELRDEAGNVYDFVFGRSESAYTLNAGILPAGAYSFVAQVKAGDSIFVDGGGFTVVPVGLEQQSLVAAHDLLEELALSNNGRMIPVEGLDSLPDIISSGSELKPLIRPEKRFVELIDMVWLLGAIIILLSAEWFLRKWGGSY